MQAKTKDQLLSFLKDLEQFIIPCIIIRFLKKIYISLLLIFCFQQRKASYSQFKKELKHLSIPPIKWKQSARSFTLCILFFTNCVKIYIKSNGGVHF